MPFEKGTFITPNPLNADYVKSRKDRFRSRWETAAEYEIENGILRPKPMSGQRDSYPVAHESIPLELAAIQEGDEGALLAFVRKYGMLGLRNLLPSIPRSLWERRFVTEKVVLAQPCPGDSQRERKAYARQVVSQDGTALRKIFDQVAFPDKRTFEAWIATGGGDPLCWIWSHIRTLRICRDLTRYIQQEDEGGAESYLRGFQWQGIKRSSQLDSCLQVAFLDQRITCTWGMPKGWTVLEFAKLLRRELINRNIERIHLAIEPVRDKEESFFEYRSLIEIAYWHLHNRVIDGRMRCCKRERCGKFFLQKHKGEKYCPEPTTGPKEESRCAVLDRATRAMKTYREKLKRNRKPKR